MLFLFVMQEVTSVIVGYLKLTFSEKEAIVMAKKKKKIHYRNLFPLQCDNVLPKHTAVAFARLFENIRCNSLKFVYSY